MVERLNPASYELSRLRRVFEFGSGCWGMSVAVCNSPLQRQELFEALDDAGAVVADLSIDSEDIVSTARTQVPRLHQGPVFLTGLEDLFSSSRPDAHHTLAQLNRSRERWRREFPGQLLVFWVSEQAWVEILRGAPDFRAWISHEFDFVGSLDSATTKPGRNQEEPTAGSERRISELWARLKEVPPPPPMLRLRLIRRVLRLKPTPEQTAELANRDIPEALDEFRESAEGAGWNEPVRFDLVLALDETAYAFEEAGMLGRAQEAMEAALQVCRDALLLAPGDPRWRRYLAVSLNRVAEISLWLGMIPDARRASEEAIRLLRQLLEHQAQNQELLANLASALACGGESAVAGGDFLHAGPYFAESAQITQDLVAQDPKNTRWRFDLAIAHDLIGNLAFHLGDFTSAHFNYLKCAEILDDLSKQQVRTSSELIRSMGVSLDHLGDLHRVRRESALAQQCYGESLKLANAVFVRHPGDLLALRSRQIAFAKLGYVALDAKDLESARNHFRESLHIAQDLTERDPDNATWQIDLAIAHHNVAKTAESAHETDSETHNRLSFDILSQMKERGMDLDARAETLYKGLNP